MKMTQKFQPGDLVRLKSGGPTMVISCIKDNTYECVCMTFAGTQWMLQSWTFYECVIEKENDSEKEND